MTIAAGFRCEGALLLCADSEITGGLAFKTNKSTKLSGYKDTSTAAVMAAAGDWDYSRMTMEMVKDTLRTKESFSFKSALKTSLIEMYENQIAALPPGDDTGFQLLTATREEDGSMHLFKTSKTAVTESEDHEFIGTGEPLGTYLSDTLYDNLLSVQQATFLAAYILRCIKKFVPACGGRSDIVILKDDGGMFLGRQSDITDLEECFTAFDKAMKFTFLFLPHSLSVREIDESKERMASLLGKCSKALRFTEIEGNF